LFLRILTAHEIHMPRVIHRVRALSSEVNSNRANGHCYDFAWIYRSWTFGDPYFSFDGPFSLPIFYILRKNEKNLLSRSLNILQNASSNSVHLTTSFSCVSVSIASLRVKVCKNDGNIWNYWRHRFTYTKYYQDFLPLLTYLWYFNMKTLEAMLNYEHHFIKIRLVFHTPYLWNKVGDPRFLFHFWSK